MRSSTNNPFSPGSDVVPDVWAGRDDYLFEWSSRIRPRRVAGLSERGRTILGEAGLGKSTLVRRIAEMARASGDWVTPQLRIPLGSDPMRPVATALLAMADDAGLTSAAEQRLGDLLRRVESVAALGVSLTLARGQGPEPYAALTELLTEIGSAALRQDRAVVVHVDEVQNITDGSALSQLLVCLGDAIAHEVVVDAPGGVRLQRVLPIAVYLTGLPEFEDMAGARKGATFARRFATSTLAPISDDDLQLALRPFVTPGWPVATDTGVARVRMEESAATRVIDLCRGEPFLFQLAGERAWYEGTGPVITEAEVSRGWVGARREAAAHVERILERLPRREREFLDAMAGLDPEDRSATAIARAMGLQDAPQVGTTSRRLDTVRGIVERGRLYQFRHRAIESYLTSDWPRV